MKCYTYSATGLSCGIMAQNFSEMLKAKHIAATPIIQAVFEKHPNQMLESIGLERSLDFEGCFKFKSPQGAKNTEEGFLVVTATTIKFSDGCFDGPCEVIWQETSDDQACTAMLVKNLTTKEFEETFAGQVEFMYP